MSSVSQTTSPSTPGALIGNVHLSRAVLDGFHAEIQNPEPARRKAQTNVIGLLFGTVDAESIRVEHLEPLSVMAADFEISNQNGGEQLQKLLGERISAIKAGSTQNPALIGWYISGSEKQTGLLDRDIAIHNAFFQNYRDILVVLKRDVKGHFAVEIYTAKPEIPLSKSSYRAGSWRSVNGSALAAEARVLLVDSRNDRLFLDVYRTTKSLDQVESGGTWDGVRTHIGRMIPTLGNTGRTDQDNLNGQEHAGVDSAAVMHAAIPPEERPGQVWIPPSMAAAAAAPGSKKKSIGFLGTAAWLLGTMIVSVLTYVAAHLYLKPMLVHLANQVSTEGPPTATSPKPVSVQSLFGLKVGQDGTALEFRWNSLDPSIQRATSGKVVINDGTAVREVEMDRAQLASGRIAYIPVSDDVRFSLTLAGSASGGLTDSIRVLVTPSEQNSNGSRRYEVDRRPLARDATNGATAGHAMPAITARGDRESRPRTSTSLTADKENRVPNFSAELSQPLMVRLGSSLPQVRNIPGLTSLLPSTRPPAKSNSSHEVAASGLSRQAVPLPSQPQISPKIAPASTNFRAPVSNQAVPPNQQTSAPASLLPLQQRSYTPPVALYKRYPLLRPGLLFSDAVVPVIVRLDESGKVRSVALEGSSSNIRPEISKEALAAARKWRFSPAKMGDKAVSSEMRINFVFKPSPAGEGVAH